MRVEIQWYAVLAYYKSCGGWGGGHFREKHCDSLVTVFTSVDII